MQVKHCGKAILSDVRQINLAIKQVFRLLPPLTSLRLPRGQTIPIVWPRGANLLSQNQLTSHSLDWPSRL